MPTLVSGRIFIMRAFVLAMSFHCCVCTSIGSLSTLPKPNVGLGVPQLRQGLEDVATSDSTDVTDRNLDTFLMDDFVTSSSLGGKPLREKNSQLPKFTDFLTHVLPALRHPNYFEETPSEKRKKGDNLTEFDRMFRVFRKRGAKSKNFILGADDRSQIPLSQRRRLPYSNIVRLSIGCSGMLVSQNHVLTAAHCVHDGKALLKNKDRIKVQVLVPSLYSFRLYFVKDIGFPTGWIKTGENTDFERAMNDYAILTLSAPVTGHEHFLPLSINSEGRSNIGTVNFAGFPGDKSPGMWQSTCSVTDGNFVMNGNLLLTQCDSAPGTSGSPVFVNHPRNGKRIIGLVSNSITTKSRDGRDVRFNVVNVITGRKYLRICTMMMKEGGEHTVCPQRINGEGKLSSKRRNRLNAITQLRQRMKQSSRSG